MALVLGMVEMALIVEALADCGAGATVGQLFMCNPIFGGVGPLKVRHPGTKGAATATDRGRTSVLHGADRTRCGLEQSRDKNVRERDDGRLEN